MIIRVIIIVAAFFSPFFFPYPLTVFLSFCAGFFFPPLALVIGMLVDVLYYHPAVSFLPYGTLAGVLVAILAFFARRFARARIISL